MHIVSPSDEFLDVAFMNAGVGATERGGLRHRSVVFEAVSTVEVNEPVEKYTRDATFDKNQLGEVVLIGGLTRIPKLQDFFNGSFKGAYYGGRGNGKLGGSEPKRLLADPISCKQLVGLMNQHGLMQHRFGFHFNTLVDVIDSKVIIKHHADIGTVKLKLDESQYDSPLDFAEHRRLTSINESSTVWGGLRVAKALWAWDIAFDNCGICKSPILELCVKCQSNPAISEECGVAWGACNHTFHLSLHKQVVKDKKTFVL
ncbi:hypothetical protein SUGI_0452810 [Cryptomeria japonica]|nr:hypothetical protein SUGI_0452810 [Cryptomeria japonica]